MQSEIVIAKYIRLSIDDAKSDSMSIENQRLILNQHIVNMGIKKYKVLEMVDNGYSGTNFERPAVQELLQLAQRGEVQIIICKDFSRFGRSSIEMGYFLERVFPLCGVRFISVNDYYDSADFDGSTGGVDVAFKFLIHEQYSKDLSRKIKAAKDERQRRGEYIHCPFGFKKVDNKMVIDEPAADTVRWIFELAAKGRGFAEIQSLLYIDDRQTPSAYKKGEVNCLWEKSIIRKLLRDEQYIGTYVAGKTKTIEVGSKDVVKIPPEDWIRISNHHPAIVKKEIFDKVQEILQSRSKPQQSNKISTNKRYSNIRKSPLKGKVYCGSCGYSMQLSNTRNSTFHCNSKLSKNVSSLIYYNIPLAAVDAECHKLKIEARDLERKVLKMLREKAKLMGAGETKVENKQEQEISALEDEKCSLYDQFIHGDISRDDFKRENERLSAEIEKLQSLQKVLAVQDAAQSGNASFLQAVKSLEGKRTLSEEVVATLIDKVKIYLNGYIEMEVKCK